MFLSKGLKISMLAVGLISIVGFTRRAALIQEFTLEDSKGANGFSFSLTDGIEPVFGFGNDLTGSVQFNLDNPAKSTGKLVIGIKSLKLTSDQMTENMMGDWCLGVKKFPTATFEVTSATVKPRTKDGIFRGSVTGKLTIHGVTKTVTAEGTAKYLPGAAKVRYGDKDGDLLMLHTEFDFNRFDYNIAKDFDGTLISNRVHVRIDCAATAFKTK